MTSFKSRRHCMFFLQLCVVLMLVGCRSWGKFWEIGSIGVNGFNGKKSGELWSNTLTGTASESVIRVEVSISGGAWNTATGNSTWRYAIPFSANLKVGKKYRFKIRGLGSDGAELASQSIDMIRRQNHDINGDGYPDAVFSAISFNTNSGRVYVYYGKSAGITSTASAAAGTILTGGGTNQKFGIALGIGDVNGDGFADLVVGGDDYNSSQGGVWIFYGSSNGIAAQTATTVPPYPGGAIGDFFGGAIALGDMNGDGYQDVSVASRERSSSAGTVYLHLGSSTGLAGSAVALTNGSAGDRLGTSLATADLNNDGYADIIAGAPTTGNGTAKIFAGISGGMNTTAIATITGEAVGDRFGENLLAIDFNDDGFEDLIVGATQRNAGLGANQGVAYLLPGNAAGSTSFMVNSVSNIVIAGEALGNQFPRAAAVTDVNGDGFMDIVLSAHLANTTGTVYIFEGRAASFVSLNASASSRRIIGITSADGFGVSLAAKDFNSDGYSDIWTGAYQRNAGLGANQGTGSVFFGKASGITATSSALADVTILGENAGDLFGYTEN